ncbi:MAG: redoxin domain-containing protein [Prevotella sp.]|nr:redoxin domain-containing protein [Prevotella sp.]
MNKHARPMVACTARTIITILLALAAMTGLAQVKCHVEGTLETDAWGDEIIICEAGTDLRVVDEPRLHVKAKDRHFTYDIETDYPRLYEVFFLKQHETGRVFTGKFIAENCNVNVTMYKDKRPRIVTSGEEGRKHAVKDSIEDVRFWNPVEVIDNQIDDESRRAEFYKADFISTVTKARSLNVDSLPQTYVDSIRQVYDYYMQNKRARYTDAGWKLMQRRDSITADLVPFRFAYDAEHPMLWTLYDVLDAIRVLKRAHIYAKFNSSQWEPYLTLYHDKLINYYPGHPIHEQIATAETAYRLQPGKPYIDYKVRNTNGQLVPISTLIQGKVALIDLWASWCGPCRRHSIAMIPVYEKYKDKGFTVVAIAREQKADAMQKAMERDSYPWPSLLELNDENGVWRKNGADNSGGAMYLIDRDGTILSTSTDAEELESIIKKALNID